MNRAVVVAAVIGWSSSTFAQSASAQAEALFRQGRSLLASGKTAEACSAFEESQKLEAAVSTLLNLAACREKNNELASAWGNFVAAERASRSATDAATKQMHQVAQDRAQKLESRLSTLAITVASDKRVAGLEVRRNEVVVEPGTFDKALPIDGGTYKITARVGSELFSTTIIVGAEHDVKSVEIPWRGEKPVPPPPAVVVVVPPPAPVAGRSHALPIAVTTGAAVLLVGALGFDLWGDHTYNDAKAETDVQERRDELYNSANMKRYIAEGLVVGGIATAGIAVWLWIRHPAEPSQPTGLVIAPTSIGYAGVF